MTNNATHTTKCAYGLDELIEILGLGRSTIYSEIKSGRLQVAKVGRRSLVLADDLAAYIAALKKGPAPLAAAADPGPRKVRRAAELKAPISGT